MKNIEFIVEIQRIIKTGINNKTKIEKCRFLLTSLQIAIYMHYLS